ncbi:hypothetical protein [Methanobrevibacter sp.]|uniref:hypothetical protein n=1 Tax=Methanobrevibacter sp. TaxID=66852 RepID=UPI00388D3894
MATCNLTLYKHTKLDDMKNFVVDDLAAYLSTKANETITGFQYQRFEIHKTIKLDKSQSYLLKGQSLNKYDYCKISTGDVDYFYFILRASWKAEETIELELKMDTLNTFNFSDVASDSTYTLSDKTLVTREHKDRFKPIETYARYIPHEATLLEQSFIDNWKSGATPPPLVTRHFIAKFDFTFLYERVPSLTFPLLIVPHDNTINVIITNKQGAIDMQYNNINKIEIDENRIVIHKTILESVPYDYNDSFEVLFDVTCHGDDVPTEFSPSATWDYVKQAINDEIAYSLGQGSICTRLIDQFQEGLSTYLFKKDEETLFDGDGVNQWYVVYASVLAVTTAADDTAPKYVNPVAVRFYSDLGYEISSSSAKLVTFYAKDLVDYDNYAEYILLNRETLGNGYFEYNGVQYRASDLYSSEVGFAIRRDNKNMFTSLVTYGWREIPPLRQVIATKDSTAVSFIRFYDIASIPVYIASSGIATTPYQKTTSVYIGSEESNITASCKGWDSVDLSDPLLIKAFAFPYSPVDALVGKKSFDSLPSNTSYSTDGECLELVRPQDEAFSRIIEFEQESPMNKMFVENPDFGTQRARNIKYESKLFHSDYFQAKFVYDSFSFTFNFEDLDEDKILPEQNFKAQYIVSKNIVSKFAFIFMQYICKRGTQNYNDVLTIERNNEKALYNNAYLNYIRSGGYSYDTKKASSQNAVNGITTALSVMGGTASLVAGWGTGNAMLMTGGIAILSSTAAMVTRNIHVAQEQDRGINQKMMQSYVQGTSVQGSEDIDILTAISQNKAKLCYYELSDIMKNAMWDLFHYCGYATHEQKIPDVTTRLYFNYVQADIVFDEFTFNEDIADDIKNKWKQGVTFFHKVNDEWDIEQQYENFEVSLI